MASNYNYNTRAGLNPSEDKLPYSISTSMVEEYLQRKLNAVVSADPNLSDKGSIELNVYTTEAGSKFLPFMVVLPLSVMKNRPKKNKKMPAIFDVKDDDHTVILEESIMKLFAPYAYDNNDQNSFFADNWRRAMGVSRDRSQILKGMCRPKIASLDNGNMRLITFMIDPIRVFHDMLTMPNDQRNFMVDVKDWKKVKSGEYIYNLTRSVNKKNKNRRYSVSVIDELNRKMRGSRN